MLFDFVKKN